MTEQGTTGLDCPTYMIIFPLPTSDICPKNDVLSIADKSDLVCWHDIVPAEYSQV